VRKHGDFREALGVNWIGGNTTYKVAAAPTSQLVAHSYSRIVLPRKTLLLANGIFFSLDRCLLNG
jgi:hypothetical protein